MAQRGTHDHNQHDYHASLSHIDGSARDYSSLLPSSSSSASHFAAPPAQHFAHQRSVNAGNSYSNGSSSSSGFQTQSQSLGDGPGNSGDHHLQQLSAAVSAGSTVSPRALLTAAMAGLQQHLQRDLRMSPRPDHDP
jgi:hypothetical protein